MVPMFYSRTPYSKLTIDGFHHFKHFCHSKTEFNAKFCHDTLLKVFSISNYDTSTYMMSIDCGIMSRDGNDIFIYWKYRYIAFLISIYLYVLIFGYNWQPYSNNTGWQPPIYRVYIVYRIGYSWQL